MSKVRIKHQGATAFSWFAGWLFTIGFVHLSFWKGVLAIVIWPYYLGTYISALIG